MTLPKYRITKSMAIRMAADAVIVNLSLIVALVLRFVVSIVTDPAAAAKTEQVFTEFTTAYLQGSWILTLVFLVVASISGFYTYSRAYQGQYKMFVITQAVGLSYLLYGFLTYFFTASLAEGVFVHVPRGALVMAFVINLGLTLASRSWTVLWERMVRPEREIRLRQTNRPVKNVLVIGGAGYIGSALLPKLLDAGYRVRVLDMFLYGTEPIAAVADNPRLELIRGDFRHVEKVVEAVRDMDAVIHLGAIVGDPACDLDERVTIDVNLSATRMIAEVAKASGISRFIFASTCSVYGACDEMLDERSEVKPISLYGHTKLAAERGLQSMADATFTPTILRFATIYGLSGRTRFDLVVNLLAAKSKIDGQITVFGGSQWRPFVHVDDAALAVFTVLRGPQQTIANEVFNVGSDQQNYTIEQVGKMIHQQALGAELLVHESDTDKRNYRVSFRKIRNTLGFEPAWTVEKGINQVIEAVADGQVADYRDAKYSNVKFLSETGAIEIIRSEDEWAQQLTEVRSQPQLVD